LTTELVAAPAARELRLVRLPLRVSLGTATAVSILLFARLGFGAEAVIDSLAAVVLVAASAEDLRRRVIPNRLIVPAWILMLALHTVVYPERWREWLAASLGVGMLFLLPSLLYPAGLGMGDVKLVLFIGAALGQNVVPALLIGTLAAAAFGLCLLARRGSHARQLVFPLGPFLAGGAIISLVFL
jgi:leader peptidase (prepilin peptidase)/N-methyltransferase